MLLFEMTYSSLNYRIFTYHSQLTCLALRNDGLDAEKFVQFSTVRRHCLEHGEMDSMLPGI